MRKLTVYFTDRRSAGIAAYALADLLKEADSIVLSEVHSEDTHIFDYSFKGTFVGGFLGIVTGLLLQGILISGIFPLACLICGLVIGAITGCIIDFVAFKELPLSPALTVSANKKRVGFIFKLLRQRGAMGGFLHK